MSAPFDWNAVKSNILFVIMGFEEDRVCVSVFDRDVDEKLPVYSTMINKQQLSATISVLPVGKALCIGMMNLADAQALIGRGELPIGFEWKKEEEK